MTISSLVGEKYAYVTLFPVFFWGFDLLLGESLLFLLLIGTIVSNYLKNLLALPRPPSMGKSPLWCPKRLYDFGMPSSHSCIIDSLFLRVVVIIGLNYKIQPNNCYLLLLL
jgi:acid phosphatase family membrane protein YuiD